MSTPAETPPRSLRRTRATSLLAALATVAGVLAALSAAAPAQADVYDPEAKYGYAKVIEPEAYLHDIVVFKRLEVLHVDTEHMDGDGFWYAYKAGTVRGFDWRYQPFGMWCGGSSQKVEWNPWMNTHGCGVDWPAAEAASPGITERTNVCRASTGHPWTYGSPFPGDDACTNVALGGGRKVYMEPDTGSECAPWEDQGLTASGGAKCRTQRYEWENATVNSFWSPAPDACTGIPADANKNPVQPDAYIPAGAVPDCTGAALALNCPTGSVHQACTGVPQVIHVASGTATVNVTDGTASASATKSAKYTATAYRATKTAKAKFKGKVYKASKTVKVIRTANRAATVTTTVTDGAATKTVTLSCSGATPVFAQACAVSKAQTQAASEARTAAAADATTRAKASVAQAATTQAAEAARQAVVGTRVSKAEKKAAAEKAKKRAVRAVAKQIAKAKKRG